MSINVSENDKCKVVMIRNTKYNVQHMLKFDLIIFNGDGFRLTPVFCSKLESKVLLKYKVHAESSLISVSAGKSPERSS